MSAFLKMGHIRAILKIEGNVPSTNDLLIRILSGYKKRGQNSLSRLVGMLFGPDDLFEPKLSMIDLISFSVQGAC